MDTQIAVTRLNSQLPLKVRQEKLDKSLITIHQNVLYSLVKIGRAPTREEISQQPGGGNVDEALKIVSGRCGSRTLLGG